MSAPLASWNENAARNAILEFGERVTREGTSDYIPPEARIAVFDNDGTLWCEKPLPIQGDFLFRRLAAMAQQDPSLRDRQPWKAVVENDTEWLANVITKHYRGDDSDFELMAGGLLQCYAGSSVDEFARMAKEFLFSAEHPRLKRIYAQCIYQPMVELLRFLEEKGFTNFIVSGGGRDFMRPATQELYGVPPERVIGSSVALEYREDGGAGTIVHKAAPEIFDDGPVKPVRIWSRTGRRPVFGAGNSNGDIAMLQYAMHPSFPSCCILVDHDDDEREFQYRHGAEESLKRAERFGWQVVSMRQDWKTVFPPAD